jgi:hypothetical protein
MVTWDSKVARSLIYEGVDGSRWHLHGRDGSHEMGDEGVYLTSLNGFYHPVRVPLSQTPAYMRGAKPGPSKTDPSRIDAKVFTSADTAEEWEDIESAWWEAWDDEADGLLIAGSRKGTYREQPVRLLSYPTEPFDYEPDDVFEWTMNLIAYSPGWRGQTLTSTWTQADPHMRFANPGDLEIWPQIAGWGHDGEQLVALPDGIAGDTINLSDVEIVEGEHWLIDTDQLQLPAETVTDTQLAARFAGMRFKHPIPKRTTVPVEVPVTITGATAETEIKAYMTPLYKRPWG